MLSNSLPILIEFWICLIILIPSTLCSIFVLYCLLTNKNLRCALHNHAIIILLIICLICQLTNYPWMLYYYGNRDHWHRSYIFCSIWGFIDWGFYMTQSILFAWASIERHILVFHDGWISTRKKRFFIHYFPLIFLILYCLLFYCIIYLIPICKNFYNDFVTVCISSCLFYNSSLINMWEVVAHEILSILIIILSSIALLIRVIRRKHRTNQAIQWKKYRKMTIQVLLVSILYLIFSFPNTLMVFMYVCGLPTNVGQDVKKYTEFFSYLVILLFPFVCILPLSEVRNKIKKILHLQIRQRRTIYPQIPILERNQKTIKRTILK